jgi:hypothetical protein
LASRKLKIDNIAKYLAPLFVHYQDFNLIKSIAQIGKNNGGEPKKAIEDIVWEEFKTFNYEWRNKSPLFNVKSNPLIEIRSEGNFNEITIKSPSDRRIDSNKVIGLANLKVNEDDLKDCVMNKPNLSSERRDNIFELLNYAIKKNVDMIVLPELSIPLAWLPLMVKQCYRHQIGMVLGLEYIFDTAPQDKCEALNMTAVILPIENESFKTCFIRLRQKNHYSPGEVEFLRGHHKKIPSNKGVYDLFHWNSCYFSVYNCFELTDIKARGLLKSKVDFIVATEMNRDVNYFSNIAESWARDIHCYIVQVNSSQYGDSRIVSPSKSELMNLVNIKGGKFPLLIVDKLDIEKLRQFQILDYNLQLSPQNKDQFKPTPADFDYQNSMKRIKDQSFIVNSKLEK